MPHLYFRRLILIVAAIVPVFTLLAIRQDVASSKEASPSSKEGPSTAAFVPAITATNVDSIFTNVDGDGRADPGDTLQYTVTITNSGAASPTDDALAMLYTSTIGANETLVPGSLTVTPVAGNDTFTATGNITATPATSVLANDVDPLTGVAATGMTVSKVNGLAANVGAATATTATGRGGVAGSVTMVAAGTFTYEPPPGFTGSDTFTYNPSKGGVESGTATVTITVSGMAWFIDNTSAGLNRGTFSNPFTTIAAFNTANTGAVPNPQDSQNVVLRGTTYNETDGINLRAGQTLTGGGTAFNTVLTTCNNCSSTYTTFAGSTPGAATINATAGNAIDLASNHAIRGLNVGNTPAFFGFNGAAIGNLTVATVTKSGTGGAINVTTSGAFGTNVNFASISSTSSPGANINLVGVTGTLGIAAAGTGLTGSAAASNAINISGGGVVMTFAGNVTKATAGALLSVSGGHNGTLTFQTGTLSATAGTGLQFDNADGTYTFSGTNTMNGGDAGVDVLNGSSGTFNFSATSTIASPTGTGFNVGSSPGNPIISFPGTITYNTAGQRAVNIDGTTGGSVTINAVTAGSTAGGVSNTGININNANGSVSFTTLNLGLLANRMTATAVTIAGGSGAKSLGTANIFTTGAAQGIVSTTTTGAITIATGNVNTAGGAAFNISGTSAASPTPLNIQLVSVNASGGTSGVILANTSSTGSPGGFRVFGTGTTDGTGGVIQNTTGRGASFITAANIFLNNMTFTNAGTSDLDTDNSGLSTGDNLATNAAIHLVTVATASLTNVDISGGAEQGINGNTVSAFSLVNSSILNAGTAADEDSIHFYNMSGTSVITNTILNCSAALCSTPNNPAGGGDDHLNLQTQSGTLNLTISGGSATNANKGSGYLFGIRGTTNATITINNTSGAISSTNNFSGGIVADVFDNSTMALAVSGVTSSGNNDQLSVSAGDNSNVDLNATGNTLSSVGTGDFVALSLLGSALDTGYTFDSRIVNNTITVANGLSADGLVAFNAGGGFMNSVMTGNTFNYAGTQRAILIQGGQDGTAKSNMTVTGNIFNVSLDGTGNAVTGILAQVAVATPAPPSPGSSGSFLCLDAGGGTAALRNTFTHPLGNNMAGGDIRVRQRFDSFVRLPGYTGAANDNAAVVTYLAGRNTLVNSPTATATNGIGVDAGALGFLNTSPAGSACTQPNPFAALPNNSTDSADHNRAKVLAGVSQTNTLASFVNITTLEDAVTENRAKRSVEVAEVPNTIVENAKAVLASEVVEFNDPIQSEPSLAMEVLTKISEMISPTVYAQDQKVDNSAPEIAPEAGELLCVDGDADVDVGTCAGPGFTLPAQKSVTITYRVTLDPVPVGTAAYTTVSNQGTVSGGNFTALITDGPGGSSTNPTVTNVDHTTVAVASNADPSILGQPVTFTATMTGVPSRASDPPGTVLFKDNGVAIGTAVSVVVGTVGDNVSTAAVTTSTLTVGSHTITAEYSGGGSGATGYNLNVGSLATNPQTVGGTAVWDGSASSNWNDPANWATNFAPIASNDVDIPAAGVTNNPVISAGSVTINSLVEATGRTLTINAGLNLGVTGTCTINGTMSVAGTFTCGTLAGTGTVNFTGAAAQSIPALTYNNLTISNAAGTTLAGNTTVNGVMNLTAGNVNTGANAITFGTGGTMTRTAGHVIGNVEKNYAAPVAFTYHVGTATGYSPLTTTVTAVTGPSSLRVIAVDGTAPGTPPLIDATTLDRYWTLTETGDLTANLLFTYLQADVDGIETNYRVIRIDGLGFIFVIPNGTPCPGAGSPCVNATANTMAFNNVSTFSHWTAGELAPTAAGVSILGRVFRPDGRGLSNAKLTISNSSGVIGHSRTNTFGYYRFLDIPAGQDYIISATHKSHTFQSRLVSITDDLNGIDFIPEP